MKKYSDKCKLKLEGVINKTPKIYGFIFLFQDGAEYDMYGNNVGRHKKNPVDTSNQTVIYPVLIKGKYS